MTKFDKIGDTQFRVMCEMFGVKHAVVAAKNMGLQPTQEQIYAMMDEEESEIDEWGLRIKGMHKNEQREQKA